MKLMIFMLSHRELYTLKTFIQNILLIWSEVGKGKLDPPSQCNLQVHLIGRPAGVIEPQHPAGVNGRSPERGG